MSKKTFSVIMEQDLLDKLEAAATKNRRKRSAEINVAVEFYLNHLNLNLDEILANQSSKEDVPKTNEKPTIKEETVFYNKNVNLDEVPEI